LIHAVRHADPDLGSDPVGRSTLPEREWRVIIRAPCLVALAVPAAGTTLLTGPYIPPTSDAAT
jgi:hypothetical protein